MWRKMFLAGVVAALVPCMGLAEPPFAADPQLAAAKAAVDAGNGPEALDLFKAAAGAGNSEAMAQIAWIYLEGAAGVPQDYAAAREWAQKAAEAGAGRGDMLLGEIWMKGLGVVANQEKALDHLKKADSAGDMKAGRYIGLIAREEGDPQTAARWFRHSAELGDITSQYYLGQAYETGAGAPLDYVAAMAWYRKSASRGDVVASDGMIGMAGLYEHGLGVTQDAAKALALYQQAAALGNEAAKAALIRFGK